MCEKWENYFFLDLSFYNIQDASKKRGEILQCDRTQLYE